jgi:hypothetical protein
MSKCAIVGCHAAGTPAAGLDLTPAGAAAALLNKDTGTTDQGSMCASMKLLNPGVTPATGVFIDKITMNPPPCGQPMPYGTLPSATEQACLIAWANGLTATAAFTGEDRP